MAEPGEHKTVQARILQYAREIGWGYVAQAEAEKRRGVDLDGITSEDCAMLPQLMKAQIRVHDLDLGEILQQPVAEFSEGTFQPSIVENGRNVSLLGRGGEDKGRRRLKYMTQ